ncbi:MAG TPA: hypothetical protein VMS08_02855 [Candidatus Saccharimonadia bacterium]|nr:hypothetical protein [Candidatus Saccharimonadia bacterium]
MRDYTFTRQLAILLSIDTVITIVDSYVPQNWTPIRIAFATMQFGFMAATMLVTVRRVLQDY